mgnify:CR=1 FL=1
MKKIVVIGGGTMGLDIAQVFAKKGYDVVVRDINDQIIQASEARLNKSLDKLVAKGKLDEAGKAAITGKMTFTTDLNLAADADLVVEAAVENLDIKKSIFGELDKICKPETILASNTSSISMTSLAAATSRPEKVVGMHFFSPVPVMSLVEIVYGLRTSKETIDIVDELGKSMGKRTILAKDKPGFIVNRMLLPMLNEAVQVLDEDIGSVEDVDEGMMRGCNHPMGPLALADMIGLDILLEVMETFYLDLGDTKYRPAHLLRKMVSAGYLGRKSGAGFYTYDEGKKIGVNPVLIKA